MDAKTVYDQVVAELESNPPPSFSLMPLSFVQVNQLAMVAARIAIAAVAAERERISFIEADKMALEEVAEHGGSWCTCELCKLRGSIKYDNALNKAYTAIRSRREESRNEA